MKDKLEWSDIGLMDYMKKMEVLCLPSYESYKYQANTSFIPVSEEEKVETIPFLATENMARFRKRYNEGKIKQLSYDKYVKNELIQYFIQELELDRDKFWLLLLFLYDFCESLFLQGKTMKANPFEQLEQLLEIIEEHSDNMTLNIKAGKVKATIDDPHALRYIYKALFAYAENTDEEIRKYLSRRIAAEEDVMVNNTPLIAYFANKLLLFFNSQPQVVAKRKKGANHSIKETDLVCLLIYFTRLSTNESWLETENETLKPFIRNYKNYQYPKNVSGIYCPFVL